jgi:CheY-like chemotaxis protein
LHPTKGLPASKKGPRDVKKVTGDGPIPSGLTFTGLVADPEGPVGIVHGTREMMIELATMTPELARDARIVEWEGKDYILVVEDDGDVSETVTEVLQEDGHRVVTFEDGRLALDYLRQKSILPRLILLDFLMPHMDGWQFLAERRNDDRIAEVPVVGISGSDRVDERSLSTSLVQFLRKPLTLDALLAAVRRCAASPIDL